MHYRIIIISALIILVGAFQVMATDWEFKGLTGRTIYSLAADPNDALNICAGTDAGVYYSINGGSTWSFRISADYDFPDMAYAPLADDTLLCIAGGSSTLSGIHYSTNYGQSWTQISTYVDPRRMAFDPTNPGFIYICFPDGILKSQNYGQNVSAANDGLPDTDILDVLGDGVNGIEAYAVGTNFLAHTVDFGNNWTEMSGQFNVPNHNPYRIAFEPNGPETLYVACHAYFARSINGGITWDYTLMSALEFKSIVCDPNQPGKLFVGSAAGGGVFVTNDAGDSFNVINNSLGNLNIQSLALDINGNLYAGTENGVYFMAGPVGIGDKGPVVPELFRLGQNYPNPFNNQTVIEIFLGELPSGQVEIYDIAGRLVKILPANDGGGWQQLVWNGTDEQGKEVSSGLYLYRLKAEQKSKSRLMILLK
ncbi:MAG: T9SS type A sorting domain-containing protein [candidate division Zixibacteria bacterium]|nr:T9SS type A sorting domain-containing protein [candidate division Zixibacteria bacterium]